MALHTEANMQEVPAPDDLVPEGSYHVRVSKVEEKDSEAGKPMAVVTLKIQTEGPAFGRQITVFASLQSKALFTLKGMYKAAGYNPGPEGHDPEQLLDTEFYCNVVHGTNPKNGGKTANVPPYSFKSITDGPAVRR